MSNEYGAARLVIGLMEFLGWCLIILGVLGGFAMVSQQGGMIALAAGVLFVALGLLQIAGAQIVRAQIDTARNTAQLVEIARRASGAGDGPVPGLRRTEPGVPRQPGHIKTYKGQAIVRDPSGVRVGARVFENVILAERWIDGQQVAAPVASAPQSPPPPKPSR